MYRLTVDTSDELWQATSIRGIDGSTFSFMYFEAHVDSAGEDLSYTLESMGQKLPVRIRGVEYLGHCCADLAQSEV